MRVCLVSAALFECIVGLVLSMSRSVCLTAYYMWDYKLKKKTTIGIVYEFYYFPIVICVSLVSKVQGSIFIALLRCSLQVSV